MSVLSVQSSDQKGNQHPERNKNKRKNNRKGGNRNENVNNGKNTHDSRGDKQDKCKVKFPCKLCKDNHLTYLCPLIDEASRFLA